MYPLGLLALGLILLVIGLLVAGLHVLFIIGVILAIAGLILYFIPVGGGHSTGIRRRW